MDKIVYVITNNEINYDEYGEKEELPVDQDIEEEDNEPAIFHNKDDIIEDDIIIESSYDSIEISVEEDSYKGVYEIDEYEIPTIDGDYNEQEMDDRGDVLNKISTSGKGVERLEMSF